MNRQDIDKYLNTLGKCLRKRSKNTDFEFEIIIVGGASIVLNYDFRQSTLDIDAYTSKLTSIKEGIREIQEKFDLEDNWLNSDFKFTPSYTENLRTYAKFYKNYYGILNVYTITGEYMICMKLVAFRSERTDIDDIMGIINNSTKNITYDTINSAMYKLYNGWDRVSNEAKLFIKKLLCSNNEAAVTDET